MKVLVVLFFSFFIGNLFAQQSFQEASNVELFPNPTSEVIFIKNGELIDSYTIYDLQGRAVQSGYKNAQVISLIDLPIGNYIFELKIGDSIKRIKIQKY